MVITGYLMIAAGPELTSKTIAIVEAQLTEVLSVGLFYQTSTLALITLGPSPHLVKIIPPPSGRSQPSCQVVRSLVPH